MSEGGSYLDNKLRSLRGGGTTTPGVIRSASPGLITRTTPVYPTMNTVSSGISIGRPYDTIQPTFVNREPLLSTIPVRSASPRVVEGERRVPLLITNPASPPTPIAGYPLSTPSPTVNNYSSPLLAPVLNSPSFELRANPNIYTLTGTPAPAGPGGYQPLSPAIITPSYEPADLRRLVTPAEDQHIKNKLKQDIYNITDTMTSGDIQSLHDSIHGLRDKLPMERSNSERMERNLVEQLMEDDLKRQNLAQKMQEKDLALRQATDQATALERVLREVGARLL